MTSITEIQANEKSQGSPSHSSVEERARQSLGTSGQSIYEMVRKIIHDRVGSGQKVKLLDVGCGTGNLFGFVSDLVTDYEGVDIIRYKNFPEQLAFHKLDLDSGKAQLPDAYADFVVAVETIEHLENPRAFVRELTRLCRPGGWVIVTTPNQLSLLSKLTLIVKGHFNAFADSCYPAHITALLEIDLRRIATECHHQKITMNYTLSGRIPGTPLHWPKIISNINRRLFSDNIAVASQVAK